MGEAQFFDGIVDGMKITARDLQNAIDNIKYFKNSFEDSGAMHGWMWETQRLARILADNVDDLVIAETFEKKE